jgi:N-acetylgalactosamine-6-sulfatase
MSREGALFTDWLSAAAICTPSRASLFTGRLPIRNGLYANDQYVPASENSSLSSFGLDAWHKKDGSGGLPSSELTFATLLQRNGGYDTKLVGKWHLGQKQEYWPLKHGFDEFVGSLSTHDHRSQFPCTVIANGSRIQHRLTNGNMSTAGTR